MKLSFSFKIGIMTTLFFVGLTMVNVFFFYTNTRALIISQMGQRLAEVGQAGAFLFDQPQRDFMKHLTQEIERHALPLTAEMRQIPSGELVDGLEPELAQTMMAAPEFQQIVQELRQIKASSRSQVTPLTALTWDFDSADPAKIRYVYLLVQTAQAEEAGVLTLLADADYDEPDDATSIGMLYHVEPLMHAAFEGEVQMAKEFVSDPWGTFLSAAVPLKDKDGQVIAVLALDYDVEGQANQLVQLRQICLTIIMISLGLSVLFSTLLSYGLSRPLRKLQAAAKRVEARDFNTAIEVTSYDELGMLAHAFNAMVSEIRAYSATMEAKNYEMTQLTEILKENENRLAQFLEALPVAVYITNAQAKPIYINRQALALLGEEGEKSRDLLLDRSLQGYVLYIAGTQERYPVADLPLSQALRGQTAHTDDIEAVVGAKIIPLEVWASPIFNAEGQLTYAIAVFQNIYQRKQTELALVEYQRNLETRVAQDTATLRSRVIELATLNRVTQTVAAGYDLDTILKTVVTELVNLVRGKSGGIALLNELKTELRVIAHYSRESHEASLVGLKILVSADPVSTQVIQTNQSLVIFRPQMHPLTASAPAIIRQRQLECIMIVPIFVRGSIIGTIGLDSDEAEREFLPDEVKLVETIAGQVAGAIERARLFEQEKRQRQIADSLRQVSIVINSSLDQETVLHKIMEQLKQVIDYNGAAIFLPEGHDLVLVEASGSAEVYLGSRVSLNSWDTAVLTFKQKAAQCIADVSLDPIWQQAEEGETWGEFETMPIRSWMGAPLLVGENAMGVLTVDNFRVNAYGQPELEILQLFAHQAAIAIRNGQLYTEAQHARQAAEAGNEAKSAFLANVSHELRTPLTSVLGFAKIIQKRFNDIILPQLPSGNPKLDRAKGQVVENMEIIVQEGIRLTTLINDVLDLAKIEADKIDWHMQPLVVAELVEQAFAATSALWVDTPLQIIKQIPPDLPLITGDKDRLIQVIINLISNAVKFTEEGSITCEVYLQSAPNQSLVVIAIRDTGMGIAPADQSLVFEKFKQVGDTLTNKPKGTGLGLSISKEIVERHGGKLWLESELGCGSCFSFSIPVR